jgi:hypothetical protein
MPVPDLEACTEMDAFYDRTPFLAKVCDGLTNCPYVVDINVLADPCFHCAKAFTYAWQCKNETTLIEKGPITIGPDPDPGLGTVVTLSCK